MARTRIKICGITREQDLDDAVALGVDALGFVFYPPSPRCLTVERAAMLAARVPAFVTAVGLFVNPDPGYVTGILGKVPLDLLQFHGEETPDACAAFGKPYVKAARMAPGIDLLEFAARYSRAKAMLLDAHVEAYGGVGQGFDWNLIPARVPLPIILSGGLNPANIERAIRQVRPWAVDVSSGVESAKGIKDRTKMAEFIAGVRHGDEGLAG